MANLWLSVVFSVLGCQFSGNSVKGLLIEVSLVFIVRGLRFVFSPRMHEYSSLFSVVSFEFSVATSRSLSVRVALFKRERK